MRAAVLAAAVLGCGTAPATFPRSPTSQYREIRDDGVAELSRRIAAGDRAGVRAMLEEPLAFGGLWFPDVECRKQFSRSRRLEGPALDAFAACLATVQLQPSDRLHRYPDVAILTYEPGIELDA